jgi:hypothetical protein
MALKLTIVPTQGIVATLMKIGRFAKGSIVQFIQRLLPRLTISFTQVPHANKDTHVRSVEAPTHYQVALVKQPVLKNNFSKLPNLPSPVKSNVLNKELIGYDSVLRKHLVSGFQYGFRLRTVGEAPSSICQNHKSATDRP